MSIEDKRYHIGLEFCGHPTQHFVLRFCGDFVDSFHTKIEAEVGAVRHAEKRGHNHTDFQIVASSEQVLWLLKRNIHRVAYGADVTEFKGFRAHVSASEHFASCVVHQIECGEV